jgi:hypothetical protein
VVFFFSFYNGSKKKQHSNVSYNTDRKEKKIFLIYKEIHSGAFAKSYMRKGFLIYEEMRIYFPIYEEVVTFIYDFATAPS